MGFRDIVGDSRRIGEVGSQLRDVNTSTKDLQNAIAGSTNDPANDLREINQLLAEQEAALKKINELKSNADKGMLVDQKELETALDSVEKLKDKLRDIKTVASSLNIAQDLVDDFEIGLSEMTTKAQEFKNDLQQTFRDLGNYDVSNFGKNFENQFNEIKEEAKRFSTDLQNEMQRANGTNIFAEMEQKINDYMSARASQVNQGGEKQYLDNMFSSLEDVIKSFVDGASGSQKLIEQIANGASTSLNTDDALKNLENKKKYLDQAEQSIDEYVKIMNQINQVSAAKNSPQDFVDIGNALGDIFKMMQDIHKERENLAKTTSEFIRSLPNYQMNSEGISEKFFEQQINNVFGTINRQQKSSMNLMTNTHSLSALMDNKGLWGRFLDAWTGNPLNAGVRNRLNNNSEELVGIAEKANTMKETYQKATKEADGIYNDSMSEYDRQKENELNSEIMANHRKIYEKHADARASAAGHNNRNLLTPEDIEAVMSDARKEYLQNNSSVRDQMALDRDSHSADVKRDTQGLRNAPIESAMDLATSGFSKLKQMSSDLSGVNKRDIENMTGAERTAFTDMISNMKNQKAELDKQVQYVGAHLKQMEDSGQKDTPEYDRMKKKYSELIDVQEKTTKSLSDLDDGLKQTNITLKDMWNAVAGTAKFIDSIGNTMGVKGGGLLNPLDWFGRIKTHHEDQGELEYQMARGELGYGQAMHNNGLFDSLYFDAAADHEKTHGKVDQYDYIKAFNEFNSKIQGQYGGESDVEGMISMSKTASLLGTVYEGSRPQVDAAFETFYKDLKMSAEDANLELLEMADVSKDLNIPFGTLVQTVNTLSKELRNMGIDGGLALNAISNLTSGGMALDIATQHTKATATALTSMTPGMLAYAGSRYLGEQDFSKSVYEYGVGLYDEKGDVDKSKFAGLDTMLTGLLRDYGAVGASDSERKMITGQVLTEQFRMSERDAAIAIGRLEKGESFGSIFAEFDEKGSLKGDKQDKIIEGQDKLIDLTAKSAQNLSGIAMTNAALNKVAGNLAKVAENDLRATLDISKSIYNIGGKITGYLEKILGAIGSVEKLVYGILTTVIAWQAMSMLAKGVGGWSNVPSLFSKGGRSRLGPRMGKMGKGMGGMAIGAGAALLAGGAVAVGSGAFQDDGLGPSLDPSQSAGAMNKLGMGTSYGSSHNTYQSGAQVSTGNEYAGLYGGEITPEMKAQQEEERKLAEQQLAEEKAKEVKANEWASHQIIAQDAMKSFSMTPDLSSSYKNQFYTGAAIDATMDTLSLIPGAAVITQPLSMIAGIATDIGFGLDRMKDIKEHSNKMNTLAGLDANLGTSRLVADEAIYTGINTGVSAMTSFIPFVGGAIGDLVSGGINWALDNTGAKNWLVDKFTGTTEASVSEQRRLQAGESWGTAQEIKDYVYKLTGEEMDDTFAIIAAKQKERSEKQEIALTDKEQMMHGVLTAQKLAAGESQFDARVDSAFEMFKDAQPSETKSALQSAMMEAQEKGIDKVALLDAMPDKNESKTLWGKISSATGLTVDELKSLGKQMELTDRELLAYFKMKGIDDKVAVDEKNKKDFLKIQDSVKKYAGSDDALAIDMAAAISKDRLGLTKTQMTEQDKLRFAIEKREYSKLSDKDSDEKAVKAVAGMNYMENLIADFNKNKGKYNDNMSSQESRKIMSKFASDSGGALDSGDVSQTLGVHGIKGADERRFANYLSTKIGGGATSDDLDFKKFFDDSDGNFKDLINSLSNKDQAEEQIRLLKIISNPELYNDRGETQKEEEERKLREEQAKLLEIIKKNMNEEEPGYERNIELLAGSMAENETNDSFGFISTDENGMYSVGKGAWSFAEQETDIQKMFYDTYKRISADDSTYFEKNGFDKEFIMLLQAQAIGNKEVELYKGDVEKLLNLGDREQNALMRMDIEKRYIPQANQLDDDWYEEGSTDSEKNMLILAETIKHTNYDSVKKAIGERDVSSMNSEHLITLLKHHLPGASKERLDAMLETYTKGEIKQTEGEYNSEATGSKNESSFDSIIGAGTGNKDIYSGIGSNSAGKMTMINDLYGSLGIKTLADGGRFNIYDTVRGAMGNKKQLINEVKDSERSYKLHIDVSGISKDPEVIKQISDAVSAAVRKQMGSKVIDVVTKSK